MKTEDFERLKAVCEKEGFEIIATTIKDSVVVSLKKDHWDGVEFAKNTDTGKIIKLDIESKLIKDDKGNYIAREVYTPSTESAYIEHLKKDAFERFGEIKDGDMFQCDSYVNPLPQCNYKGFMYFKENDCFSYNGCPIYQQGHWAIRVKERVEVTMSGFNLSNEEKHTCFDPQFFIYGMGKSKYDHPYSEISKFLANQLEEYLNR